MEDFSVTRRNTETLSWTETFDVSLLDSPVVGYEFTMHVRSKVGELGAPLLVFRSTDNSIAVVSEDTEEKTLTLKFTLPNMNASGRLVGEFFADLMAVKNGIRTVIGNGTITLVPGVTR